VPFVGFILLLQLIHLQDKRFDLPVQMPIHLMGGLQLDGQFFNPACIFLIVNVTPSLPAKEETWLR
jgi:hypothetical protein